MDIQTQTKENLEKAEFYFKNACEQIVFLNKKLAELQDRYTKAQTRGQKAFRYSIRLKIAAAEGIRNAYYEYACLKADQVTQLRFQVYGQTLGDGDEGMEVADDEIEEDSNNDDGH